ncbi:MAG: exodeoxyribonuclease VII large subunit, partial [Acidimicrobiales bacterium]|nr:exodeoxyribonuclease VII large subunit [Acidimicrobiales bacterium]
MSHEARAARLAAIARARDLQARDAESLSISALYRRVDRAVRSAVPGQVWVSGEVRSVSVSSRGICYLELVDPADRRASDRPVLKAVCWSRRWATIETGLDRLGVALEAGLVVRLRGEVQLYSPRGEISFIVSDLDTEALLGRVAAERARLVKTLVDADLYDRNRQIPVPLVPSCIGLVASPGTEGYRDFVGQLEESGMGFTVRLVPTRVQGRGAAALVAGALRRLQGAGCDVIVVVRGGGSKADLATFDSEPVARAIARSDVAVWTGIGHTGDLSVADEVANRAFVTPTECGRELAGMAAGYWSACVGRGLMVSRLARARIEGADRSLARRRRGLETCADRQLDGHADRLGHRARALRGAAKGQVDARLTHLSHRAGAAARACFHTLRAEEQRALARGVRLGELPGRVLEVEELRAAH